MSRWAAWRRYRPVAVWLVVAATSLLAGCGQPSTLERVRERGELVIATRSGPTTFYRTADGFGGIEYELAKRFADHLGVRARFVVHDDFAGLLDDVATGRVHMAAAGLAVTRERAKRMRFAIPYQSVRPQFVYRRGNGRPDDPAGLGDGSVAVAAGSRYVRILRRYESELGRPLNWHAVEGLSVEQLVAAVDAGTLDYTIADANELALLRRYLAYVYPAFDAGEPDHLAWAFPRWPDDSLVRAADAFFRRLESSGQLAGLLERYYGFEDNLNFVDKREFWRNVAERLPRYQSYFEAAAAEIDLDWRLLAAIGYQESHWNADAVSPTGVRGIMMLTRDTATQLGVEDRRDPRESIFGGARYLRVVEAKIPERIPEPDRLWLTLAGYNIGFGHLEDARILTQRQGGDPDRWEDVRQRLPLLAEKAYYRTVKHGYARGKEPVRYVDNVRSFYELLLWHTQNRPVETDLAALVTPIDEG